MGRYDALTTLEETPKKHEPLPAVPPTKTLKKTASLPANQQTSKATKTLLDQDIHPPISPPPIPEQALDTSLLTTKEKTKYGTYLTDESIEKISILAIQLKRDAHQIVQEAINQYLKNVEK